jgi:predicted AAA+ superfamily ATPase
VIHQRKIFSSLESHLSKKEVTVLTGMRRTGKTTLIKELMNISKEKQKLFFDLERLDYRKLFQQENYDTIVLALEQQGVDFSKKVLIVLDEIQLVPNLPSVIKYLYDHYDIKFIVTGSSSYYIKNKFQESMAGRKKIFEIYPLDFGEFLTFNGVPYKSLEDIKSLKNNLNEYERLKSYYELYIAYGGFPQVVIAKNGEDKKDVLQDIISSYINIDILQLSDIRKTEEIEKLIRLLASRIGSKLDISKLANTTRLSRPTVENYLYLLESSYLISTIPVYSMNPDKEIVKAKKVYFSDTGIAVSLTELSSGAKFENSVFNQLKHYGEISYYQMKNGNEIDFILDKKTAFEVKETPYENDYTKMMRMAKNVEVKKGHVIARHLNNQDFESMVWGGMIR